MEFLIKIKCSDSILQKDVLQELKDGIKQIVGGGNPDCEYLQKLSQIKIVKFIKPRKLKRR